VLTESQIRQMMPLAGQRLNAHVPYIAPAMEEGGINKAKDIACFMAQLAHESGEYRYMREIHDGSDYESRDDLGNVYPGDGVRYPGRGGIQVTGRAAARECGKFFKQPFEEHPELMEKPQWATHVSVWFWTVYKKIRSQRFGVTTPFIQIFSLMEWPWAVTKGVNGGYTHIKERLDYYQRNRNILKLPPMDLTRAGERSRIKLFQMETGLSADGDAGADTSAKAAEWLQCQR